VVQWIDVTGRDIEDVHDEMHRVAVDIIQNIGNKQIGHLWTNDADVLRTDSSS